MKSGVASNVISSFKGEHRFLSNFYPSPIRYGGYEYPTVEHAYQASKTLDLSEREMVRLQLTPGMAKSAGRRVTMRPDWERHKVVFMEFFLLEKFGDHLELGTKLLATGDAELIEGNTWNDRFWGAVFIAGQFVGENMLGQLLMRVRSQLREFRAHLEK